MDENLFRKSSIERATSPEQLNNYIKINSVNVWVLLISIIIFLFGALVWSCIGHIDTTLEVGAVVEKGEMTLSVMADQIDNISEGQKVMVKGNSKEYFISSISEFPTAESEVNPDTSKWVYPVYLKCDLEDGSYRAVITIDSVTPISFIIN